MSSKQRKIKFKTRIKLNYNIYIEIMNIWSSYIWTAGWRNQCKEDPRSYSRNLCSCEKKPEKKNQVCRDSNPDLRYRCSAPTNWANKPTGSWSLNWCVIYPWKMKMKLWIYEVHIFELQNEEINVKKILAVIHATYAVTKRKPEKKLRLAGIRTLTSAIPVQSSNQLN